MTDPNNNAPAPSPTPAPTSPPSPTPTPTKAPNHTPSPTPAPTAAPAEGASTGYRPDGLPDHLFGKDDKETIAKLNDAYKGARTELGKKGFKAPETLDGYILNLPEDIKGKVLQPDASGKDPLFEMMKPIFHKNGISADGAQELTLELYKAVAGAQAKQAEAAANDPNAADFQFKQLGGNDKAKPVQDAANAWINAVAEKVGLDEKDKQELGYLTMHSQGLRVLNKLRALTSEKPIPADFGAGDNKGAPSQADIEGMMADQRYIDGDEAWHKKVAAAIRQKQIGEGKIKAA